MVCTVPAHLGSSIARLCLAGLFLTPQTPLPALSIRRFSQDAPITSPRPPCGPWNDWSVTSAGGSGVSPRESPVLWPDATWRSMSVTHAGAEPAERRRLMARVDIWRGSRGRGPGLWPGRAARGRRAPAPWAHGFPRASRAPSQPWPCAWPQPHPFLPAPGCAGCRAENTALTLARRGRGPARAGHGLRRAWRAGGGSGGSGWAPPLTVPTLLLPDPPDPCSSGQTTPRPGSARFGATGGLGPHISRPAGLPRGPSAPCPGASEHRRP